MSNRDQEMITAIRRGHAAFNRGDFDAAMEMAHPEIEFVPPGGQSPLKGAAAMRAWMEPDALEDQQIQPQEFRVHGNKVLVRTHTHARGAGSGIEFELDMWTVWTLDEDGLATRAEAFLTHQESEALEAAGLSK